MLRHCCILLLGVIAIGCDLPFGHDQPRARERTARELAFEGEADAPIPCQTDADCPSLGCGPCTPGEVVPRERLRVECHVDPCIDGRSVCGPEHTCVVSPDTKKNLHVWYRACMELEAASSSICAHQWDATEITACAAAIAEAVHSRDDATCKAARAKYERSFTAEELTERYRKR
jgi:hypothetical protein